MTSKTKTTPVQAETTADASAEPTPSGRRYSREDDVKAIELGAQGCSRAEIAAGLKISRKRLERWAAKHESFAEALAYARDLELAWWETRAREGIVSGGLNATLWAKAMSGRFADEGYADSARAALRKAIVEAASEPEPELSSLERAKAVALLLAEHGMRIAPLPKPGEPADVVQVIDVSQWAKR